MIMSQKTKKNTLNKQNFDIYQLQRDFCKQVNLKDLNCSTLEAIGLFSDYLNKRVSAQETDKGDLNKCTNLIKNKPLCKIYKSICKCKIDWYNQLPGDIDSFSLEPV